MPATATPRAAKPVSERVRLKLLRLARSGSEGFARAMMATAAALDGGASDGASASGIEYVDSLNGIDVYEDLALPRASADGCGDGNAPVRSPATRLRSFCHIEADIVDVVRRLTASVVSPRALPGIVETQELCSVLSDSVQTQSTPEKEFPERAGVNWVVLTRESTRDSASSFSQSSVSTASSARDRTSSSARSSAGRESSGEDASVEFIVLSYQGIFKHRGRRGWVQWCQSVELSSFPLRSSDPTRGVMFSSGIVAVESATRPGQVSMSYAMGLDLSQHDAHERRFLEGAVWKRVMKLAAVKKAMQRESLSRTLSISSADTLGRSSQSSQEMSPTTKTTQQPECEPMMKIQEVRTERVAKTLQLPTVPPKAIDKRRQRAQTMQPSLSSSPFRDPDSLEFRLSLYSDPDELPDFSPESPTATRRDMRDIVGSRPMRSVSAVKPTKSGRPKSRSVGTGWAL